MSAVIDRPSARTATLAHSDGWRIVALVAGATMLTLATMASVVGFVLHGGFTDPDDAMRLVEVRAWIAGQPWFDLVAHRLDPPLGASMHWSRLVDLPPALFITLFRAAGPDMAERLARLAVPTVFLAALYFGMVRLADVLVGRAARVPALLGTLASGAALVSFQPGRIGHHAPETAALVLAVGCALASLDPARTRQAAVAGGLVALSLAMSLETLPFQAGLCAAMVALWIVRGAAMAQALAWFAAGLGTALPLLFVATVPPAHWLAPVCDAYGAPHLGAGLLGVAGTLLLARLSPRLASWPWRLLAAAVVGALVLGFVGLAYPACLHSPFAGTDPLVRAVWLDNVVESKPLLAFMRDRPMTGLMIVLPVALGLAGCLVAALSTEGTRAARFAVVAGLVALGLALGFWQVRVFTSVTPLALCGGLPLVAALRVRLERLRAASLAPVLILPFTTTGWAVLLPGDPAGAGPAKSACLAPSALAPLAALPPGRVVAPIDSGSHLIEATALDVFAAPYHRNNDGNRFALDVFLARPEAAAAMLATRHVGYVMTCPGMGETARLAARAPDGLAAHLVAGDTPAFLTRQPLESTPYAVYVVKTPR